MASSGVPIALTLRTSTLTVKLNYQFIASQMLIKGTWEHEDVELDSDRGGINTCGSSASRMLNFLHRLAAWFH